MAGELADTGFKMAAGVAILVELPHKILSSATQRDRNAPNSALNREPLKENNLFIRRIQSSPRNNSTSEKGGNDPLNRRITLVIF